LNTIVTEGEIKDYLLTLLAPGRDSKDFINDYLNSRFPPPTTNQSKSKANNKPAEVDMFELSDVGQKELKLLDQELKSLNVNNNNRNRKKRSTGCFCSGRQHELSKFIPNCFKCGLIFCFLNSPVSSCPSCENSSLLPQTVLVNLESELKEKRSRLLEREKKRWQDEIREKELERRKIKFPELGTTDYQRGAGTGLTGGGYAGHAGGSSSTSSLNDRISRGYETGISLNGKKFGGANLNSNSSSGGGGKVLRLDGKGKVKVETRKKKSSSSSIKKPTEKENRLVVRSNRDDTDNDDDDDDDDNGLVPWIDPTDDGIRRTTLNTSSSSGARSDRKFENFTLDLKDRPKWIEREEMNHSIADERDDEVVKVESVPITKRQERKVVGAAG
jgi:hypothetical protein